MSEFSILVQGKIENSEFSEIFIFFLNHIMTF